LFHQGFNNCFSGSPGARMYYQVFGPMITAWRKAFADEKLPFCIISLCTAGAPQTSENFLVPMYDVGPLIREAQYKTFVDFRRAGDKTIGFVSSYDLRKSWYHPQIKTPAGERAAKWALATHYGLLRGDDYWLPPEITDVKVAEGRIVLTLSTQVKTKRWRRPPLLPCRGQLLHRRQAGPSRPPAIQAQHARPHQSVHPRAETLPLCVGAQPDGQHRQWARRPASDPAERRLDPRRDPHQAPHPEGHGRQIGTPVALRPPAKEAERAKAK